MFEFFFFCFCLHSHLERLVELASKATGYVTQNLDKVGSDSELIDAMITACANDLPLITKICFLSNQKFKQSPFGAPFVCIHTINFWCSK